jgi:hypothetical protein
MRPTFLAVFLHASRVMMFMQSLTTIIIIIIIIIIVIVIVIVMLPVKPCMPWSVHKNNCMLHLPPRQAVITKVCSSSVL